MSPRTALALTAALCAAAAAGCAPERASRTELDAYRALRGSLVRAETSFTGMRGRYAAYRITLRNGDGVVVTGRLLQPARDPVGGRRPAIVLNDGRELNSGAILYLPPDFGDVVVLSIDYPPELPYTIDLAALFSHRDSIRKASRLIPVSLSLAAAYLARRADVDSTRIAIAATSFAVPFAVIAAATDERFRNVALIYGAGDLADVVAANLTIGPRMLRGPIAWLATRPFTEFEPERYAAAIAPRRLVMVNGVDDPQMPRAAVESLYDAAREPKALIWLHTGHLMPTDTTLIRALVDTAFARMPVLQPS